MNSSWQKLLSGSILTSLILSNLFIPGVILAQVQPIQPIGTIQSPPQNLNFKPQTVDTKYDPASIKSDCSTKGIINFGLATLFKAIHAGGGADKTSILGFKPPEIFPDINYDVTLDVGSCVSSLLETGARYAFVKFKKRLLDRLTDDTIAWINGETDGRPKFFNQPFSQVLLDAADAAAGDALLDLGLGEVCSPFRAKINLELNYRQRPVQEAVRCTLSQVVDNFEAFGQDFSQGNWLAYSESLKPQNNPWGATLIAKEAVQKAYKQKTDEKQLEILIGQGYTTEKKCIRWSFYAEVGTLNNWKFINITKDIKKYPHPDYPPPVEDTEKNLARRNFGSNILGYKWTCSQEANTIPGSLIKDANTTAFTKDYDYVVNSDDLTPYLDAIFDAAMNRLIKMGADGLMQGTRELFSDNSENRPATALNPDNPADKNFIDNSKDYEQATNPQKTLAVNLKNIIASSTLSLRKASSTLITTLASSTQLKKDMDELVICETNRFGLEGTCKITKTIKEEVDLIYSGVSNTRISLNNAQANIDTYSVLNENYSEPILTAAINAMSGVYSALEEIDSALLAQQKIIEEKIKTSDIKNQLMLCNAPSQPYVCKP